MTPDELRRMDNDLCIIYEKGIKPVKAKKYYYFREPIARKLQSYTMNHNDFDAGERGEWRKFNPYNPYVPGKQEPAKDLKVESLDDLFEDELEKTAEPKTPPTPEPVKVDMSKLKVNLDEMPETSQPAPEVKPEPSPLSLEEEAPVLPQTSDTEYDLQKEIEAKFDELFGPIDED